MQLKIRQKLPAHFHSIINVMCGRFFSKQAFLVVVFFVLSYLIFFYPLLDKNTIIYSGKDSTYFHYPRRFYLYETLHSDRFPFWTERIYSGFPVYADLQSAYLSIPNLVLVYLFGPINSYKMLHFLFYISGSIGFFILLRRKGANVLGALAGCYAYFFSFFMLYHQQHFDMVLSAYLFPVLILVCDLFVEKRKLLLLGLIAFMLSQIFCLGSFQILLLMIVFVFVYFLLHLSVKVLITTLFKVGFLSLAFCLPGFLPTIEIFMASARSDFSNFLQGSFNPALTVNLIFPFLFGLSEKFMGVNINREYVQQEVYVYLGIVPAILGLLGFLVSRKDKFFKFCCVLCFTFMVLGFVRYVPVFNKIPLFPFSVFRYWGRSVVLFSFALSYFIAAFISTSKLVIQKHRIKILLGIPLYFLLITVFSNDVYLVETIKYLGKHIFILDSTSIVWLILFCLTVVSVMVLKNKYLFVFLVVFDLAFFGHAALKSGFTSSLELMENDITIKPLERYLEISDAFDANKGLYYKQWGLFGYSAVQPEKYKAFLESNNVLDTKFTSSVDDINNLDLKNLGVSCALKGDLEKCQDSDALFLDVPVTRIVHTEGRVLYTIDGKGQFIKTRIRNYIGWTLKTDGVKNSFSNASDDLYLEFYAPKGDHTIEMVYKPTLFYYGLIGAGIMLLLFAIYEDYIKKEA